MTPTAETGTRGGTAGGATPTWSVTGRAATRLAWGVWAVALSATVAGLVFLGLSLTTPTQDPFFFRGEDAILMIAFGTVGAVIAARRPSNPIGWLFLLFGTTNGASLLLQQYATYAVLTRAGALPGGAVAAWAFNVVTIPGYIFALAFVLLLFPDGRLPSRRWRVVGWFVAVAVGLAVFGSAGEPGPLREFPEVDNPFAVRSSAGALLSQVADVGFVLIALSLAVCMAAVVVRFRTAEGVIRVQLKWFLFAGGLLMLGFVVMVGFGEVLGATGSVPRPLRLLPLAGLVMLPVSTAIAILRYRLYDIDRIISRTASYLLLTGVLVGVYVSGVLVGPRLLAPTGVGSDVSVAAATLVAAAVFGPARRRIQAAVDRRFDRARYDAAQVAAAFGERLRDETDLDDVIAATRVALAGTVAPAAASIWLREPGNDRRQASSSG